MKKKQMSETFLIGVILSLAGGYLDAYTYICRGQVFANAQTGNIVLLGMNLAAGNLKKALLYVVPVIAFGMGIVLAEAIKSRFQDNARPYWHWRQVVLLTEVLVLLLVGALPLGKWNMAANVLVSFVCAMQVQTFRKINGSQVATTMCTGNFRSGTELLVHYRQSGNKEARNIGMQYYGIIFFFMAGAGIGAVCTRYFSQWSILMVVGLLVAASILMFVNKE